jgi:hypothetical protein
MTVDGSALIPGKLVKGLADHFQTVASRKGTTAKGNVRNHNIKAKIIK